MLTSLEDSDLPGFWRDADRASIAGQHWTLRLTRARLLGLILAALGGALTWTAGHVDMAALVVAAGFATALIVEVIFWVTQPERDWYSGRALAESSKTLAWRYAVCADPFPADMSAVDAKALLMQRIDEVSREARDRVTVRPGHAVATSAMDNLRASSFDDRRAVYLNGRTRKQHKWYADKAEVNKRNATAWRLILISGEVISLGLAAARIFGDWDVDLAGLCAAVVASGTAWTAVKQFTTLASAYSTTASELALQTARLETVSESDWSLKAADAEEAISREHTLWLASRTGRNAI